MISAALCALVLPQACEEVTPDTDNPVVKPFRIKAALPSQTKTQLVKEGDVFKTYWSAGDVISVNGHLSTQLQAGGEASAEFVFENYQPAEGDILNILYPGAENSRFTIPASQTYTDGLYPAAAAPMWGSAQHPSDVQMNHLCTILRFNFTGQGTISGFTLTANGGERIAGEFALGYADGTFNGALSGGDSYQIEVTFEGGLALGAETVGFNVPVLAGTYGKGFTMRIYNTEGKYAILNFFGSGKTLDPLKVYDFESKTYDPDVTLTEEYIEDYREHHLIDEYCLTVGTYNILASNARSDAGNNTWDEAKGTLSSIITSMGCDVMTLNELESTGIAYLQGQLEGYEWVLKPNYNGGYAFAPGIIYRTERIEKLADGIFWLSVPDAASLQTTQGCYSYWDTENYNGLLPDEHKANEHRCCVWARFKDKVSGKEFYFFASHPEIRGLDLDSSKANTLDCLNAGNCRSLAAQVPLVNTEGLPFIVAGDMNTWSGHISYTVFEGAGWTSAFDAAAEADCLSPICVNRPGTDIGKSSYDYSESRRIDHVFNNGFNVLSYDTIFTQYTNTTDGKKYYPSDHLPVKVRLNFSEE